MHWLGLGAHPNTPAAQGITSHVPTSTHVHTRSYVCFIFLPIDELMEEHWTNRKNNPAKVNKGSTIPFVAMLGVESLCWLVTVFSGRGGLKLT